MSHHGTQNSNLKYLKYLRKNRGWKTYIPKFEYCTDNAAMIGIVGYLKFNEMDFTNQSVSAKARYKITQN